MKHATFGGSTFICKGLLREEYDPARPRLALEDYRQSTRKFRAALLNDAGTPARSDIIVEQGKRGVYYKKRHKKYKSINGKSVRIQ